MNDKPCGACVFMGDEIANATDLRLGYCARWAWWRGFNEIVPGCNTFREA